jgi:hypothetical protein
MGNGFINFFFCGSADVGSRGPMHSRTMVEPVEVCSETTIGPAHSGDVGWPQAASNPMPPFAGNGESRDVSEAKEKAYRLPSPTSVVTHEMQSPFCLVPGALATALRPHVCLIPVPARGLEISTVFLASEAASGRNAGEICSRVGNTGPQVPCQMISL